MMVQLTEMVQKLTVEEDSMDLLPEMIQKLTVEGGSTIRLPEVKPTLQEALGFLHDIKNRCDPEKYKRCIDIFKAFQTQTSVLVR